MDPAAVRAPRTDAVRSRALLLEAARAVFAEQGVDAPPRAITDRAGLGVGTLYRHFPHRADLVLAVFQQEIERCAAEGRRVRADREPGEALVAWIDRYAELVATKHGFASALHSSDPAFADLPEQVWGALLPIATSLLGDAVEAGALAPTLSARELLVTVALLCQQVPGQQPGLPRRTVRLLLAGLAPR